MKPRPYQTEAVDRAFADWARGCRSTLFVCPTGGGKSFVFALAAERHLWEGGRRVLIIADRKWLVSQAKGNILEHTQRSCEIEMGVERVSRTAPPEVVCASVQTFTASHTDFPPDAFSLIVFDEADLALAPSYRKIANYFPHARILGVTATPERHDGLALSAMFDSVCLDVDIRDLIDIGYLANVRQWPVKVLDLSRVKINDGDFDEASLERVLMEERHLHEVVKPTMDLSDDRPTLVFGMTVNHAKALAAVFNRYRPGSARAVSGKTPPAARLAAAADFTAGRFQFLCNCNLIMRGVDIPPIACVAMARPTRSRTIYTQGLGRGLRLSPETGKVDLLTLDFTDGADNFSLVSAIDVLGGRSTPEAKERARELLDEKPGADVGDVLDRAAAELAADEELRDRVRAKVSFRTREVALREPIDWKAQPLGVTPDAEIAQHLGVSRETVTCARHRLGIEGGPRADR